MAQQIQIRRDTAANWTSNNPTLASGEMGKETDTNKYKWGDGTTAWNSLAYFTIDDASTTVKGKVELAIASEVTTGTSDVLATTPDALAGSDYGKRFIPIWFGDPNGSVVTTGDGKGFTNPMPAEFNGWNIVGVIAGVTTASSSGAPLYQLRNVTQSADVLSTRVSIDANEYTSQTAATAAVIDTNEDDITTGDIYAIDKDTAGSGEKGDNLTIIIQKP